MPGLFVCVDCGGKQNWGGKNCCFFVITCVWPLFYVSCCYNVGKRIFRYFSCSNRDSFDFIRGFESYGYLIYSSISIFSIITNDFVHYLITFSHYTISLFVFVDSIKILIVKKQSMLFADWKLHHLLHSFLVD